MSASPTVSPLDRVELRALVETYALGADRRDGELVASVFTEDGVLFVPEVPKTLSPSIERRGRAEIARVIPGLDRYFATMHAIVGQVVTAGDGPDDATAVVSCLAHHVQRHKGELIDTAWSLRYHDTYTRASGDWLIARRELWCDFIEVRPVRHLRTELDTEAGATS